MKMKNKYGPAQDPLDSEEPWSPKHRAEEPVAWARYILGLPAYASAARTMKHYRRRCRYWQSDKVSLHRSIFAKERLQEIQSAYFILTEQLPPGLKIDCTGTRQSRAGKADRQKPVMWEKREQAEEDSGHAAPEATPHFHTGVYVTAKGLKGGAHLNGKSGIIRSLDKDKDLYLVQFEGEHGQQLLEPDHLDLPWSLA